jgi:rhodanese-related sulfurtransferase
VPVGKRKRVGCYNAAPATMGMARSYSMGQLAEFVTHHPIYVLGLLAALGAVLFYELRLKSQDLTQISAPDAVRLINKGALVVDVRPTEAYQRGHIVNARNIELGSLQANRDAVSKQKSKLLVTVCDNGTISAKAAKLLRQGGYENVFSLRGGLAGWRSQNLPLVK